MSYAELAAVVGGTLYNTQHAGLKFNGVTIDSRELKPGELFIAIRGENNNGHNYLNQSVESGVSGVIVEKNYTNIENLSANTIVVGVEDTHQAMLKLARHYRRRLKAKFIGITGSNGKTTTKELTYRLLKAVEEKIYCSPGNFNNLYGVPLALFSIDDDAKVAVMELGISTKDEMPTLAEIVHPNIVLFTNVGPSHLEFLASVEDVARAKLKLLENVSPITPALVNADDLVLISEAKKIRNNLITFGIENKADFTIDSIEKDSIGNSLVTIDGLTFVLPLMGKHQAYNLLAAYAICKTLGYSFDNIDTKTIELNTAPMRGQIMMKNGIKFVVDCYNANPDSVKAGLETFFEVKSDRRRVVILGDMLELGTEAIEYHKEVGKLLLQEDFDLLITVGPMAKYISENTGLKKDSVYFENSTDAAGEIQNLLKSGDFVYLKASRGIGLEKILNMFDKGESI